MWKLGRADGNSGSKSAEYFRRRIFEIIGYFSHLTGSDLYSEVLLRNKSKYIYTGDFYYVTTIVNIIDFCNNNFNLMGKYRNKCEED